MFAVEGPRTARWAPIGLALATGLAVSASKPGWALGVRFGDLVAVRGEAVTVRVEVLEDPGVVDRIEFELRRPDGPWIQRTGSREQLRRGWWSARFTASEVWTRTASSSSGASSRGSTLQARMAAYGPRGGRVLAIGYEDPPAELQILEPQQAREREQALRSSARRLEEELEEEDILLAGLVGLQARLSDPARFRAWLGASIPLQRRYVLTLRVSAGPSFSPPADRPADSLALGTELGFRVRSAPPRVGRWSSFLGPRLGAEFRFPGVDGLIGGEAGLQHGLSRELSVEISLVSSLLLGALDGDITLGVTGGLRLGLRFGGSEPDF